MKPAVLLVTASTAARRVLANPGGLLVSVTFYVVVSTVLSALWRAAVGAHGGPIDGYTAVALTWYACTTEAATVTLNSRLIEEAGGDIASGAVAVELLRPTSVLAVRVASELGATVPRLAACMCVGLGLAWVQGGPPPNAAALLLVVPSLVLAVTVNIVAQHAFAGVSFWIRDARSTWYIYQKVVFVVGGMLLPLEVLPAAMESVARVLPFMAMAYAPARIAAGHVEPWLIAAQVGWLAAMWVVAASVFSAGERRLQVVGG